MEKRVKDKDNKENRIIRGLKEVVGSIQEVKK